MSLRVTCPECGLHADLSVFLDAAEASRGYAAALEVPAPLAGRVVRYLRLFAPPKKALSHRKAVRLLTELAQAVRAGEVQRKGQVWAAPLALWESALDLLLEHPPQDLPLESHGYLLSIVASQAARGAASAERQRAERARAGTPPSTPIVIDTERTEMTNDLRALQTLEAHNPGTHTAEIARLKAALATHQPPTETAP